MIKNKQTKGLAPDPEREQAPRSATYGASDGMDSYRMDENGLEIIEDRGSRVDEQRKPDKKRGNR